MQKKIKRIKLRLEELGIFLGHSKILNIKMKNFYITHKQRTIGSFKIFTYTIRVMLWLNLTKLWKMLQKAETEKRVSLRCEIYATWQWFLFAMEQNGNGDGQGKERKMILSFLVYVKFCIIFPGFL